MRYEAIWKKMRILQRSREMIAICRFLENPWSRKRTIPAFNNPDGEFARGELYIFVYGMNGTGLALSFQQAFIGTDRSEVHDSSGVAYITGMNRFAAVAGGSIYYVYPNPARGYAREPKSGYVLPVDGTWFVGSGVYAGA